MIAVFDISLFFLFYMAEMKTEFFFILLQRDESITRLYRHYPWQTLPSTSQRSRSNSRPSNYRMAQLRRNLNRRQMDLESVSYFISLLFIYFKFPSSYGLVQKLQIIIFGNSIVEFVC